MTSKLWRYQDSPRLSTWGRFRLSMFPAGSASPTTQAQPLYRGMWDDAGIGDVEEVRLQIGSVLSTNQNMVIESIVTTPISFAVD